MTVHNVNRQPVSINSSKIIDWLVNRKLLRKDYPRILSSLKRQIEDLSVSTNLELGECPYKHPSYLRSLKLAELVASQDTQTDFFGRASQSVRSWRDLINSYERDNLYLGMCLFLSCFQAELGEDIHELASDHIPRCKTVISDRQKLITGLRQKIKELCLNVSKLEDSMDKMLKMLHLTPGETNVKVRLLEEASGVPAYLDAFIPTLGELGSAVSFYGSMRGYTHNRTHGAEDVENSLDTACCLTLRLLISSGHVPLYHWKTGHPPEQLGQNDDFVPTMLAEERQLLNDDLGNKLASGQDSLFLDIDGPVAEDINWDDDIPCDLIELSDDGQSQTTLVDPPLDSDPPHLQTASHQPSVSTIVVSGHDARPLLDTIEGRNALLNDLTELSAFLNCFIEGQIALHDLDCEDLNFHGSKIRSFVGSIGGSTTLQNIIMQIKWDDDIPCDLIELSDDGQSQTTLVDPPLDSDPPHLQTASHQTSVSTSVVSGHDARSLLDTIEGRNALLNDLTELSAFLNCFIEGQIALHDLDCEDLNFHGSKIRSFAGSIGGSTTLQNIIMQNAPPIVQSVSAHDAVKMLAAVERARDHLTNRCVSFRGRFFYCTVCNTVLPSTILYESEMWPPRVESNQETTSLQAVRGDEVSYALVFASSM
ncbi:unnamed protein product [Dicrocoelium dendriticum]|nr:unnamed protein product [Dicrocoelium dendriticum]